MTMVDLPVGDAADPPPGEPPPAVGPRRWPWALVGVALVVAAVVGIRLLDGDDDDAGPTAPSEVTLPDATGNELDPTGAELVALLEAGRGETYHATYELAAPELDVASTVEVWRADGQVRQDTFLEARDGTRVHTAAFQRAGSTISCVQRGDEPWSCAEAETPASNDLFGTVADQLGGTRVRARDDEIDGRDVRCFDFETPEGEGTTCVTGAGIPVLLALAGSEIRLATLDDDVPGDTFTPPA